MGTRPLVERKTVQVVNLVQCCGSDPAVGVAPSRGYSLLVKNNPLAPWLTNSGRVRSFTTRLLHKRMEHGWIMSDSMRTKGKY